MHLHIFLLIGINILHIYGLIQKIYFIDICVYVHLEQIYLIHCNTAIKLCNNYKLLIRECIFVLNAIVIIMRLSCFNCLLMGSENV